MCRAVQSTYLDGTHLGGARLYFRDLGSAYVLCLSYCLILLSSMLVDCEPIMPCALFTSCSILYLVSILIVIHIVARIALFIKYRGRVDPSMCVVQSKALP